MNGILQHLDGRGFGIELGDLFLDVFLRQKDVEDDRAERAHGDRRFEDVVRDNSGKGYRKTV